MTIDLRGTTLDHYDNVGGAVVTLHTNKGDFGTAHRAFTQSDKNAFFGTHVPRPAVPTPVAIYDARLDVDAIADLAGNPAHMAARADDSLFTRVNTLKPDGLRILAGHTPHKKLWDATNDALWMHAASGSKAHAVGLVAHPLETRNSLEQRLRDADRFMLALPDDAQRPVAPVISTAAKHFTHLVDYVVEQNLPLVGFEFHGLTRTRASMGYFHRVMDRAAVPPWTFEINLPRQPSDGPG